jgi:hypothetical protein
MNFAFIVAYRKSAETNIEQLLADLLAKVLEDNLNEVEPQSVRQMIRLQHERAGEESIDANNAASRCMLLSFAIDLGEEIGQIETVVEEFATQLPDTPPIFHAVMFEDPQLRAVLVRRPEEIFALEMKLRRVLTFIYLHANQDNDPYDLLRDEAVQPISKEKPQIAQMKAAVENQFFHLTFGQYVNLNQRPDLKQVSALLNLVRDATTYEVFRTEISRAPVEHEDDAVLLAGLKERMDAIETMRNCVAHYRRPSKRVVENYDNARPLVDQLLDDYLARWEGIMAMTQPATDPSQVVAGGEDPEGATPEIAPPAELAVTTGFVSLAAVPDERPGSSGEDVPNDD